MSSPAASAFASRGRATDRVLLATCGAIVPEALAAAALLAEEDGVEATVLCLSSPDRLYRGLAGAQHCTAAR